MKPSLMKNSALIAAFCLLAACEQSAQPGSDHQPQSAIEVKSQVKTLQLEPLSAGLTTDENAALRQAFSRKQSHVWLQGSGEVKKLLADDTKGARHQRFLVSISPEQTLLFAHNIDLAPRVADLNPGDQIQFKGEYIYNPKGGIVHWTHHDTQGRQGGWIKVNGKIYE
jgi:hypothetical protein